MSAGVLTTRGSRELATWMGGHGQKGSLEAVRQNCHNSVTFCFEFDRALETARLAGNQVILGVV
jgi:hypothetical protein